MIRWPLNIRGGQLQVPIGAIEAMSVLDSRGNPTVEVAVELIDGSIGRAICPSGASTGSHEAIELRDNDPDQFHGKGVRRALANIEEEIAPALIGQDAARQRAIDEVLITLDGTPNKARLGANAMLATSLAVAKAAAQAHELQFYQYLGGSDAHLLPVPMLNVLNGGVHADNNLDFQEFMIVPKGAKSFAEALRWGSEVYHTLRLLLKDAKLSVSVGDEGGFAPDLPSHADALEFLVRAITESGHTPGTEIALALDPAASEFFSNDKYHLAGEGKELTPVEMTNYYENLLERFPMIVSIEDPMAEDDDQGWKEITSALGDRIQLVGDDNFVTSRKYLSRGISSGIANAILIKLNQIGTLTETRATVDFAHRNGYKCVISHRSGETEDVSIADLAVATGVGQIKSGAPARGERTAKYNQLLRIEYDLGSTARYRDWTVTP